jgi:hypothetical protein
MGGADKDGPTRAVSQGLPELRDETREVGVRNERFRPQMLVQLVPRKNTRAMVDEDFQEVKRLG